MFLFPFLLLVLTLDRTSILKMNSNENVGKTEVYILRKLLSILPLVAAFSREFPQYVPQRLVLFETLDQRVFISETKMLYFI